MCTSIKALVIMALCLISIPTQAAEPPHPTGSFLFPVTSIPTELRKNANAVVREELLELKILNPGSANLTVSYAVTIFNATADHEAELYIWYDKLVTASPPQAAIYAASGRLIRRLKNNEIKDIAAGSGSFMEDNRAYTANMKHDEYPYTIVYQYSRHFKGLLNLPSWNPQSRENISVQRSSFAVSVPSELGLKFYQQNVGGNPKQTDQGGNRQLYYWQVSNLPAMEREPLAPPLRRVIPRVLLSLDQFEFANIKGSMNNWEAFGRFFYELNKGRDALPEEMVSKVKALTAEASSPQEKIDILYRYLQDQTRYISIQLGKGGYQTFDAKYVAKNGYGDCKALTNYMQSMLKEVGITSYAALVYAGDQEPDIIPEFTSNQFNHVILCVPTEEDTLWLECTSSYKPPGYLGAFTDDRHVLVNTPEGGKLVKTPFRESSLNLQARKGEITLLEDGTAQINLHIVHTGHQQDDLRYILNNFSEREKEKWVKKNIDVGSFDLNSYELKEDPAATEPSCHFDLDLVARNFGAPSGSRLFLKINQIENWEWVPERLEERKQPIVWPGTFLDTDSLVYQLPKNYVLESMPEMPIEFESPFGSYHANLETRPDGTLLYTRELKMTKTKLPPEAYEEVREFLKKVVKSDKIQVVLSNRS